MTNHEELMGKKKCADVSGGDKVDTGWFYATRDERFPRVNPPLVEGWMKTVVRE